jgi:VWFA-related protein
MQKIHPLTRWLLAGLILTFPVFAQSTDANESPAFGEVVDVRVVNLEVVVTDGRAPVAGLGSEDFQLLVDGEEVPIEYFTEVRDGFAVEAGAASGVTAVPALAPGESVGTRFLVFVDDYFSMPTHRNRVLDELAEQLPLLGPEDRMAVVAFDGKEVGMLTSWTRSLPELERAFDAARARRAYGLERLAEQRRYDSTRSLYRRGVLTGGFAGVAFRGSRTALSAEDDLRAEELYGQVSGVVDAASSALRAFARPEGRKVMLLLSGGWPAAAYEWLYGTFARGSGAALTPELFDDDDTLLGSEYLGRDRDVSAALIATANRLGYTLYPVDVPGVESPGADAEIAGVADAALAHGLALDREWIEEGALHQLARATGGRALVDGARSRALERALDDTRSYYWLGFSPAWREDDEEHRVKVELRQKGLKARTRTSYSDLSRKTELTMLVESAQLFDLPIPAQAQLGVTFGEPQRPRGGLVQGGRRLVVPMTLEIPLDQLALLPGDEGYTARLELRVAATDDRGHHSDVSVIPVELVGQKAPDAGQTASYETSLTLRRRPHRLLISLYDPVSGNLLSQRADLVL